MGQVVDFAEFKKKKEQEETIDVEFWKDVLDYETLATNLQLMIDQISSQSPFVDEDGKKHYYIDLDKDK